MIVTNSRDFQRKLKKFSELSGLGVGLVAKRFAFAAFRSVSVKTPVDTGRARAAWNVAQGAVDTSVPPEEDYPEGSKNESKALARNQDQLSSSFAIVDFPVFFITNNLKYILPLEKGHSKQMDKGYMVRRTMTELRAEADQLIKALK